MVAKSSRSAVSSSNDHPSSCSSTNDATVSSTLVVSACGATGAEVGNLTVPRGRRRLFFTLPHAFSCEAKTPATRARRVCLFPDRGSSKSLHMAWSSSFVMSSSFSTAKDFGSWLRWRNNRCRRALMEPDFLIPKTPRISPRSLLAMLRSPAGEKSQSAKTRC